MALCYPGCILSAKQEMARAALVWRYSPVHSARGRHSSKAACSKRAGSSIERGRCCPLPNGALLLGRDDGA